MHRLAIAGLLILGCGEDNPAPGGGEGSSEAGSSSGSSGEATSSSGPAESSSGGEATGSSTGEPPSDAPVIPEGTGTLESLRIQQEFWGWGPDKCAGAQTGYGIGEQIENMVFEDCEGNEIALAELCGAKATWIFLAHAWCPHCQANSGQAEDVHAGFAAENLASIHVVHENAQGNIPTRADCVSWRATHDHRAVLTVYDPTANNALWEEPYTALNVFLNEPGVIQAKIHTDVRAQVEAEITSALAD